MTKEPSQKTKCCSSCKEVKPLSEFYKGKRYKDGYRAQCKDCMADYFKKTYDPKRHKEYYAVWFQENKTKRYEYKIKRRNQVIRHYGGIPPKCACCGETMIGFLTIDHIFSDGAEHRRKIGGKGKILTWLVKNNFPEGFQVLCWNCNWGKQVNNGVCTHQKLFR